MAFERARCLHEELVLQLRCLLRLPLLGDGSKVDVVVVGKETDSTGDNFDGLVVWPRSEAWVSDRIAATGFHGSSHTKQQTLVSALLGVHWPEDGDLGVPAVCERINVTQPKGRSAVVITLPPTPLVGSGMATTGLYCAAYLARIEMPSAVWRRVDESHVSLLLESLASVGGPSLVLWKLLGTLRMLFASLTPASTSDKSIAGPGTSAVVAAVAEQKSLVCVSLQRVVLFRCSCCV